MRKSYLLFAVAVTVLAAGCAGPEKKFGRGMNNLTEFARLGELRRSMEQTALFEGPDVAYTKGFIHGLNRSVARTFVGVYEVLTFPFPSYEPVYFPVHPVYPDSYKPELLADETFNPNTSIGFGGGDIAPMIPGSRFRIFDY
jgi:putative exosortase-associated protein (TIGR04073 family)